MIKPNLSITLCFLFTLSSMVDGFAQSEQPDLIPPSPAATAFQRVGVEQTSPYTGGADISIPLYNLKLNELSVPISLKYTGIHGIKVQEIASWVGLGWSLNAGGAVSRTVRGLPDEKSGKGFRVTGPLPNDIYDNNIVQEYIDILNGDMDGEPDFFNYSGPGIGGAFLIDKDGSVLQVPQTDNKIVTNSVFATFTITTPQGIVYKFEDIEKVRSIALGGNITTLDQINSTWYLTEMHNANETERIYFDYEEEVIGGYVTTYSEIIRDPGIELTGNDPVPNYTETRTYQLRLSKIYDSDNIFEIFFNEGGERCDMKDSDYLNIVEIKYNGSTLKKFEFDYSYFTKTGIVPLSDPCTGYARLQPSLNEGDIEKRLMLDQVTESGTGNYSNPPYVFEYETSVFLPDRHSLNRDHWGFYNGAVNTTLEPIQYLDLNNTYPVFDPGYTIVGSADREADFNFGKGGILKKITYPLGGYTSFEFEANTVADYEIASEIDLENTVVQIDFSNPVDTIISIDLQERPFARVTATGMGFEVTATTECQFFVEFKDSLNVVHTLKLAPGAPQSPKGEIYLEAGVYDVTLFADDNLGNCFSSYGESGVIIQWENQLETAEKVVGGARIKSLSNCDGADCLTRNFSYVDDQGTSMGSLVTIPKYGSADVAISLNVSQVVMLNWTRTINSNLPLLTTSGNHVGYRRVEEVFVSDTLNGKIIRDYFSPKLIGDFELSYLDGSTKYSTKYTIAGRKYDRFPSVPTYSADWLRGLPTKELIYEYINGQFEIKSEKDFLYKGTIVNPQLLEGGNLALQSYFVQELPPQSIRGVVVRSMSNGGSGRYIKNYDIVSGRVFATEIVQKTYEDSRVVTVTTNKDLYDDYQIPLYEEQVFSTGHKVRTDYTYNIPANFPGFVNPTDTLLLSNMLQNHNRLIPFYTVSTDDRGGVVKTLNKRRSLYKDVGGKYYLDQVQGANGDAVLETLIHYGDYNLKGLPESFEGRDGLVRSFKWDDYRVTHSGIAGTIITSSQFDSPGTISGSYEIKAYLYDATTGQITTVIDANGKELKYSYDELGRLVMIRDHVNNLLQRIDYHYQNNN
ncbi:MAG: RHS repeat domain-containing protein [Cyclobacteriaceae bacterium]